jgi:anaerobic magnesium-protoporphyrin IX monomethyl ester cyclase
MKVTFIYPSLADSSFRTPSRDILMRYIHHGICYLSACARQAGFETELLDLRTFSGWDEFEGAVRKNPPHVAAVTLMSPDYSYAMKCIDIVKRVSKDSTVIAGGIHPTIRPDEMTANPGIDHVVKGEGELSFVELLKNIRDARSSERVIEGRRADMAGLPFIDRYLFDCLEYPFDSFLELPFFTIMAGRGCSYNCRFCAPAGKMVHGKGARRRSVDNVIEELRLLRDKYGMGSFMFHDDCFTEDRQWVLEFCGRYRDKGFTQDFICQTRADIICKYPDMIKTLAISGLRMVMVGFESGSDRVLEFIGKAVTLKQNLLASKICKANGIRVWALHMYGLPTETNEEARDTVRMIKRIRPYRASAAFFTPHPGSYLYDYCKANSLSLIDDHDDFVAVPEEDKPKIKGIDYVFMRKAAVESKALPLESRITMKFDRMFRQRANRRYLRLFRALEKENPLMHKLDILNLIKDKYSNA